MGDHWRNNLLAESLYLMTLPQDIVNVLDGKPINSTSQIIRHVPADPLCTGKQPSLEDQPQEMSDRLCARPFPRKVPPVICKQRRNINNHVISRFNRKLTIQGEAPIWDIRPYTLLRDPNRGQLQKNLGWKPALQPVPIPLTMWSHQILNPLRLAIIVKRLERKELEWPVFPQPLILSKIHCNVIPDMPSQL